MLENYYNNHYKTSDMLDFSELTDFQKKTINNTLQFAVFKLGVAVENFKNSLILVFLSKIINKINKFIQK